MSPLRAAGEAAIRCCETASTSPPTIDHAVRASNSAASTGAQESAGAS
jgi:hypothetical protein